MQPTCSDARQPTGCMAGRGRLRNRRDGKELRGLSTPLMNGRGAVCAGAADPPCSPAASWRSIQSGTLRRYLDPAELRLLEQVVEPQRGELFLERVSPEAHAQVVPVHPIHRLVLIEAGEDEGLLAGLRVAVLAEALGADLFHHALHR